MYVIRYTSIEPVWNFGSPYNSPAYYHTANYRRTFRTVDLDRAFEQLDRMTARRCHGALARVRQVWRVEDRKATLIEDYNDDRESEAQL